MLFLYHEGLINMRVNDDGVKIYENTSGRTDIGDLIYNYGK